jgi:hypothetical protein
MAKHFFDSHLHATTKSYLSNGQIDHWETISVAADFIIGNIWTVNRTCSSW